VAGKHDSLIGQRENFLFDSLEEKRTIAAWQVPSPDATAEQYVAANQNPLSGKEKTDAPRAVAGDMKDLHAGSGHITRIAFIQEAVRLKRLDFQLKPMAAEKSRIGDHGGGIRVIGDLAPVAALDFGGIRDVVEMAMREKEPVDLFPRKLFVRSLRSVKKEVSPLGFEKKCIGIQGAAGERFELIHCFVV